MTATVLLLLAACGTPGTTGGAGAPDRREPERRYRAVATVLESREHGPELCVGGVAQSLPPQCGGIPIDGWDWDALDGHESVAGTTWGTYRVTGTFDGRRLRLTEPPLVAGAGDLPADSGRTTFDTPCAPPAGGWTVTDATKVSDHDFERMSARARSHGDFAGLWIDQSSDPAGPRNELARAVVNVAFTGDLARREVELRQLWGGALCVSRHRHPLARLRSIQDELSRRSEAGLRVVTASVDEVRNVVQITVVVADEATRAALDRRYGQGVVEVQAVLQPVD